MLRSSSGKKCRAATAWGGRSAKTRALILAQATTGAPAIQCTSEFNRIWPVQPGGKNRFCVRRGAVWNSSTRGGGRRTGGSTGSTVRANGCYSTTTAGRGPYSSGADGGDTTKDLGVLCADNDNGPFSERRWLTSCGALYQRPRRPQVSKSPGSGLLWHGHNSTRPSGTSRVGSPRAVQREHYSFASHHRSLSGRSQLPRHACV
jgi:hypothetical protein